MIVMHIHFGMSGDFRLHSLNTPMAPSSASSKKSKSSKRTLTAPPAADSDEFDDLLLNNAFYPDPKPTTRLQLVNEDEGIVAHVSAMTVQHGTLDLYHTKAASLGEDPLREDANPETAWSKISISKKPVGLLLMDQSVIAGVGNIYRAEILYKAGVHPEQPGRTLTRAAFDSIWSHSVDLLRRGFQSGSILTVDPEDAILLGQPWTRRYCYNHSNCGRCKSKIMSWDMAGRTVYCCTTCQPLINGSSNGEESGKGEETKSVLPAARKKAMGSARQAIEFVSHCAPDDAGDVSMPLMKLKVAELRARAEAMGLSIAGKKAELVARLETAAALHNSQQGNEHQSDAGVAAGGGDGISIPTPMPGSKRAKLAKEKSPRGTSTCTAAAADGDGFNESGAAAPAVYPEVYNWDHTTTSGKESKKQGNGTVAGLPKSGTAGLGHVATAREAALEKARAGEGRGVEHVALHDDEEEGTLEQIIGVKSRKSGKSGGGNHR